MKLLRLFPLLLGALTCRAQAVDRFARWENEIAAFEQKDRAHPPEKGHVVFIGASGLRKWKTLEQDFAQYHAVNRGFGGSQLIDSVHFADRIIFPHEPRLVVVHVGGNDIAAGVSPEELAARFRAFVEKVQARLPQTKIAYRGMGPSVARWKDADKIKRANTLIEAYCHAHPGLIFIDVFSKLLGPDGRPRPELYEDGLHFNAKGYALEKQLIEPYIKEALSPSGTPSPAAR